MSLRWWCAALCGAGLAAGCATSAGPSDDLDAGVGGSSGVGANDGGSGSGGSAGTSGGSGNAGTGVVLDASDDAPIGADAACARATETATVEQLPVDIIWVVDNSSSMRPSIDALQAGINGFATRVVSKGLRDYRVIMLSLRGKGEVRTDRYGVCVPRPLAGDDDCADGANFFQSEIDIRSTQPLEQLLGTLDQTAGYSAGESRGGPPWKQWLRDGATKSIVVVTDDNSRFTADQFERFPGGRNPFNSDTLPPGLLDASRGGAFEGYVFNGLYGWGSESDPNVKCTSTVANFPAASGATYTDLVERTKGARARVCDGPSAWTGFFDAVATAVERASRIQCNVAIPTPSNGDTIDPTRVNVLFQRGGSETYLRKVANAAACGAEGGWYYDDDRAPQQVILCGSTCTEANQNVRDGDQIALRFGCQTIVE
jgi:hypothetical protein